VKKSKSKPAKLPYHCSFCGKGYDQIHALVGGGPSAFICNECVALCNIMSLRNIVPRSLDEWRRLPPELKSDQSAWSCRRTFGPHYLIAACTRDSWEYTHAPEADVVWWSVPFNHPIVPTRPKTWPRR
jgi:hypothetical protein